MATKPVTLAVVPAPHLGNGVFQVASQSVPGKTYDVDLAGPTCECDAVVKYGRRSCVHIKAAIAYHDAESKQLAMEMNGFHKFSEPEQPKQASKNSSKLDKMGYVYGQVASAMQKEIRKGDEEAAVYWGLLLYDASPQYAWKRLVVTATEDIGLADPQAVCTIAALTSAWAFCKQNSWNVDADIVTMAIVLLCRAPKSTEADDLKNLVLYDVDIREMPDYARDVHTKAGKEVGKTIADWFADRVAFGMPVNEYTKRLWDMKPEWRPK